jgi:predicted ATPase
MLNFLEIENFKCIKKQRFELPPLTILTGINSTGKSSIIQSILLLSKYYSQINKDLLSRCIANLSEFTEIRNKYQNAKSLQLAVTDSNGYQFDLYMDYDQTKADSDVNSDSLNYEDRIYYISANRIGQEELAIFSKDQKVGNNGEFIFGYFENNKDTSLAFFKYEGSSTLKYQLNCWLEHILELQIELQTEKITATVVKVSFNSDGIDNINPFNLGAGNSYVVKVLITGLMCKQGDTVLIENPEIHLHPKAQAKLGEFFAWLAQNGVQVILETHSEHLINKISYQAYSKEINSDKIKIYYKSSIQEDLIPIGINHRGHFINADFDKIIFPSGFFDSTLQELLEMG